MTKDYQIMLFDGCTTNRYLDDLRRAPGKDSKNLDLVVSTGSLSWSTGTTDVMKMLDGVTEVRASTRSSRTSRTSTGSRKQKADVEGRRLQ